jgi:hypothetical protein
MTMAISWCMDHVYMSWNSPWCWYILPKTTDLSLGVYHTPIVTDDIWIREALCIPSRSPGGMILSPYHWRSMGVCDTTTVSDWPWYAGMGYHSIAVLSRGMSMPPMAVAGSWTRGALCRGLILPAYGMYRRCEFLLWAPFYASFPWWAG